MFWAVLKRGREQNVVEYLLVISVFPILWTHTMKAPPTQFLHADYDGFELQWTLDVDRASQGCSTDEVTIVMAEDRASKWPEKSRLSPRRAPHGQQIVHLNSKPRSCCVSVFKPERKTLCVSKTVLGSVPLKSNFHVVDHQRAVFEARTRVGGTGKQGGFRVGFPPIFLSSRGGNKRRGR